MSSNTKRKDLFAAPEWCSLESLHDSTELHGDALEQMATWREDLTIRLRRALSSLNLLDSMRRSRQHLSVRLPSSTAAARCWGGGHEYIWQGRR